MKIFVCALVIAGLLDTVLCFELIRNKILSKTRLNNVKPYLDNENVYAKGTPMERPKIANSVLDVIGATPMVTILKFSIFFLNVFKQST